MNLLGDISTGIERLMAHQHAPFKGTPAQLLRWSQPAMAQESSFHIHDIRIAVEHARQVFTFTHASFYQLQGIIRREHISGIHKHQVIACCPVDTLVHRIIESLVGF